MSKANKKETNKKGVEMQKLIFDIENYLEEDNNKQENSDVAKNHRDSKIVRNLPLDETNDLQRPSIKRVPTLVQKKI